MVVDTSKYNTEELMQEGTVEQFELRIYLLQENLEKAMQ